MQVFPLKQAILSLTMPILCVIVPYHPRQSSQDTRAQVDKQTGSEKRHMSDSMNLCVQTPGRTLLFKRVCAEGFFVTVSSFRFLLPLFASAFSQLSIFVPHMF